MQSNESSSSTIRINVTSPEQFEKRNRDRLLSIESKRKTKESLRQIKIDKMAIKRRKSNVLIKNLLGTNSSPNLKRTVSPVMLAKQHTTRHSFIRK